MIKINNDHFHMLRNEGYGVHEAKSVCLREALDNLMDEATNIEDIKVVLREIIDFTFPKVVRR